MRERFFTQHRCSRCHKPFEAPRNPLPGMLMDCEECTELMQKIIRLEAQLLAEDFSITREDKAIAEQMHAILNRESSGVSKKDEEILTALVERMLKDEKRRKRILKKIRELQKEKR